MIPVLGVLILNGPHWLQRQIESIDYPVENYLIIDNNGRGELNEELNIIVNKKDIYAFKGNQYSHAIEKSGEVIHLTLFIVKKWQGSIQIKENIHDEVAYIEIAHLHTFKGLIPGDETYISGIQNYFAIN